MHIDFAPPSNGTYNNTGSCRQLANYMEHEDLERMEQGLYTESFFNLTDDNIYKSNVIKDIDSNVGQLLKTDTKFYAIHVSPSEKELRAMGNTEQEQAEAMKRYIREVFIPEYAKNFNKRLSETDIKFYGKIHFDRSRSNNELNMHCHLIVSRKDQANKKKLSPLTNHKNTKKGMVTGSFDRINLFLQVELGFDKLFNYNRLQTESFDYYNIMMNGPIAEQLKVQEQGVQSCERKDKINQDNNQKTHLPPIVKTRKPAIKLTPIDSNIEVKQEHNISINSSLNKESHQISNSLTPLISCGTISQSNSEEEMPKLKKKKKKGHKL